MIEVEKKSKFYVEPYFINILLLTFNITLFILKIGFSILTNSLALQADAFDNLTDIVMSIIAFIGLIFAKKKPNEKFPYGYYKIENIISLIISLFIFITAYIIIFQSFSAIFDFINGKQRIINYSPVVFLFLIISLLISLIVMLYLKIVSKKTNSPIIKSEANEKFFDVFISLSVLAGFIGALFELFILDSIIGLIIAIFIIKGGYDIFLNSTKTLLDAVIDFDNRTELYKLIENTPKIKKIKNMAIRSYGRYVFLELELLLNKDFPLFQIDNLKNKLREEIKQKFPLIFKSIIVIHSQEKNHIKIAVPLVNNNGLNSEIANHFGESSYFGMLEFEDNNFLKYEIITNKFAQEEKRKGILVSDWLLSKRIDKIYLKKELRKGPYLILNNNFIDIELSDFKKLDDVIKDSTKNM